MKISLIYPVKSLSQDKLVLEALELYKGMDNLEHIIISSDEADSHQATQIIETQSRAKRMNEGAKLSTGDMLLFHHPRSILDPDAFEQLRTCPYKWGGFSHSFDCDGFLYKFTSFYSNLVRADQRQIIYLDHCIFVSRELFFDIGGFPDIEIFEDTALSYKLRSVSEPKRLKAVSRTSQIRFQKNGFWKQSIMNMNLKKEFSKNRDHREMNTVYENDVELNSSYRR